MYHCFVELLEWFSESSVVLCLRGTQSELTLQRAWVASLLAGSSEGADHSTQQAADPSTSAALHVA